MNFLVILINRIIRKKIYKAPIKPARIQPDRKWFGNVRTIDQKNLEKFRVEMAQKSSNSHEFLIRKTTLPLSLLVDAKTENKMNILDVEKFEVTFLFFVSVLEI